MVKLFQRDAEMNEPVVDISFVIPCYNEQDNIPVLIDSIRSRMVALKAKYEVIITDDCSIDRSWPVLKSIALADSQIRVQRLKFKRGQSVAIWVGIQISRGRFIVTLDADLQNDLDDLPLFLEGLASCDCVFGSRAKSRHEGDSIICVLASRIANGIRNKFLNENFSDTGCGFRAFRRECLSRIRFFNGAHRFLPSLMKMEGFLIKEIPIKHKPRLTGKSHYTVHNRLIRTFVDLLGVLWMKNQLVSYEIEEAVHADDRNSEKSAVKMEIFVS